MTKLQEQRLTGTVVALFLSWFLFLQARSSWINYWLLVDSMEGTAIVTGESWSGHDAVDYAYQVGQQEYTGKDGRPWHTQKMVFRQVKKLLCIIPRVIPGYHF